MGALDRLMLNDDRWGRMSRHIIGDERTRGSSGRENRMFVEAVLRIVRTGSPWRDLPDVFGSWNSAFRRLSRWSAKGVWHRMFTAMSDDGDFEYLIEANEAFAAQALAVGRELGWDATRVNVNGGAISIGHPIGASGARVLTTLLHEMGRRDARRGLATLCIGGGMGIAICVER